MQISTVDSDALPQNNQIAWFGIKKEPLCICYTVSKSPQTSLLITPLPAPISASNFHDLTQITQRRVCFYPKCTEIQGERFFCALWVKAHSARGGVNRKHHPAERCDLRFGV